VKTAFLALAALLIQPESVPDSLPPVERCASDASFADFRSQLSGVVSSKNERALLAMLAEDVTVDFGGGSGPAAFAENWQFEQAGESRVWNELSEALSFGCAPTGDYLVAPSFVAQFPAELDAFATVIAMPGTRLRASESDGAAELGNLDWHLATVASDDAGEWLGVRLVDGREGFVRRDQVVNPLDFRLVFQKREGKWLITAFVAGD
jgi:hypothetical protein